MSQLKRNELGLSCMLNTEVGAVLAVIRRRPEANSQFSSLSEENYDSSILQSLKSLRALIFNPQQEWRTIDPSTYLSPFLDVVQGDDVPAIATGVALSAILKILKLEIFDRKTPGARDAINSIVTSITGCRLEKTDAVSEDAVLMRILQVLSGIVKHTASVLLTDQAICTIVNTVFQVVQQSSSRGNLLQRNARYTMQELVQTIFSRLPEIDIKDSENSSDTDTEDVVGDLDSSSGYGVQCAIDIFHFLCSLLNVVEIVETEGYTSQNADEDVQLFALVLINSAIELSGNTIGKHPKLLKMIQDDLFHHLVHYGIYSSPLVLSMICSTVLNIYHFLRRSTRLQLESFFTFVLLRVANSGSSFQLQEVALEGVINFCRQPTFIFEIYINYDCDPIYRDVFEEVGKLLCKQAFPSGSPLSSLQVQAFEGLVLIIHSIADNMDKEDDKSISFKPYPVEITEYKPFYEEISNSNDESWIDYARLRKAQKKKIKIAGNHFNQDEKKGLEYLKISNLVSDPPDPKAFAYFFRFISGLDKTLVGDYLGDPAEFNLQVLKEFTETFEFPGMQLDTALRTYLETFRLPGESQKIHRVIEAFSDRFYEQRSSNLFVSKDAVFILCYSLIMLNTDQHNPQVKKKMSEDDFIRNNRAINGGADLPREALSELFLSIANNAITIFSENGVLNTEVMNPSRWIQLINRSKLIEPFIIRDFDRSIGRDMFAAIAGPSVAALCALFEHTDDDELLHECIDGLFSVSRICQHGLRDTLDEILASFCKFTTLLNPYASAEETLYAFSNDLKSRMATLAVFTIANNFGHAIQGGWRNIVDCLLKLNRLKLLPQSVIDHDANSPTSSDQNSHTRSESGVIFPTHDPNFGSTGHSLSMIGKFSHFLTQETIEHSLSLGSEFEQNLKIIQQCRIGNIFTNSSNLPDDSLLNLGRSLIFSAAGKGQKFSTPVEEDETIGFCWELLTTIALTNIHRFSTFWPSFHDYLLAVAQFPLFSPIPFAEKAIICFFKVCLKLLATYNIDKLPEELIFKSINLMWKLDKEILETCFEVITESASKILIEYPANLQTPIGWKSILHLLSVTGRHKETYDHAVETLTTLMSDGTHVSRTNYTYCIDSAFGFVALKSSPLEKNLKILDLLSDSVNLLVQWHKKGYSDPGNNFSMASSTSTSSLEENSKTLGSSNYIMNLFVKLGESLRKASLARREEVRNHAVAALQKSFILAEELDMTPTNCINCFNLVIFAMVDDLHEKMLEYSRRENAEKEMRSMEGTLKIAMEFLTNVYLQFLKPISESSGFRTFWLGVLRRMDTCMKADLGGYGESKLQDLVLELLKRIVPTMKENEILVPKDGDDLWEITYIQIQWIAPTLKEELFPEMEF